MNHDIESAYGVLTEPATLTIQRRLSGPIERVWACLTDSELRSRWLASGVMDLKVNAPFELVWRNNELTDPPGKAPDRFTGEHRMQGLAWRLNHRTGWCLPGPAVVMCASNLPSRAIPFCSRSPTIACPTAAPCAP